MALRILLCTGLLSLFAFAPSAQAACGSDHPIYGLKAFGSVRCGSALVVAARITHRYNSTGDFHGSGSTRGIAQSDARGNRFTCKWQSGSTRNDVIIWACSKSRGSGISWIWRAHRLT